MLFLNILRSKEEEELLDFLSDDAEEVKEMLKKYERDDNLPLYKKYMRFGPENNVENFLKILNELPKGK